MNNAITNIVILGGGSAGWLTAGLIAAEHNAAQQDGIKITLIESSTVPPIGVGEGTWPSMRTTLSKIGISETDLFRECDASFKQGAKFAKWVTGEDNDAYYHPLMLPHGFNDTELAIPWHSMRETTTFTDAFSCQGQICDQGKAPKQITTPEYASVANYAYHLDSSKLGVFLRQHCIAKLGVTHIVDDVLTVISDDNGDIAALTTERSGDINGDLFIDCSGFASRLLGQHYQIPFIPKKDILFNDTALAVHVPYTETNNDIASHTISTAQSSGWIWDIGLPTRKGVGHVFSSAHTTDEKAADELSRYIEASLGKQETEKLSFRKIKMNPGHREIFWHKNCVAVGMSAGFLEPLEASALVLVETSAAMISADLPATKDVMHSVSTRFNQRLNYYWESIIDFLKLHYVLTQRTDSQYWVDNLRPESIPERLQDKLELWKYHTPNKYDFPLAEEMFPAASWQYILYGMGFITKPRSTSQKSINMALAQKYFDENIKITQQCLQQLPSNRELINKIREFGLQTI